MTARRIGVMGGTFDPLHIGHLVAARCAAEQAELDVVVFVVAGDPWQKSGGRQVSPAPVRFAAVAEAVATVDGFEASPIEVDRAGPSYMVDTLDGLAGLGELFLIGGEALAGIETWHRGHEISAMARLLAVDRGGIATRLPPPWQVTHIDMPRLDVSSTWLRSQMAAGRSVEFLVPQHARDVYVAAGLYDRYQGFGPECRFRDQGPVKGPKTTE